MVVIYNFQFKVWTAGKMHLAPLLSLSLSLATLFSMHVMIQMNYFEDEYVLYSYFLQCKHEIPFK